VFSICTHDADTGILTAAEAAPTYRIYEDEDATAILTGTLTALDDAVNTTGFYTELIAVTTANGFGVGKNYTVYIEATVDGNTGGIAYTFKVEGIKPLLDLMAPFSIGTVTGARTGTEVAVYGSVTATYTVDSDGNRTVVFT
jgi:hypothetical protein